MKTGWIEIAAVDDVPVPAGLEVEAAGVALLLHRIGAKIFAMSATCPHHAAWLSQGRVSGSKIFCPRHMGQFDIATGKRIAGPLCPDLPVYPVRIVGDRIEVFL